MKTLKILFVLVLAFSICCIERPCSDESQQPNGVFVYMAPDGDDSNDGSEQAPFRTFDAVEGYLAALNLDADVTVRVYSNRGIYFNYTTVWEYYKPEYNITFESYPDTLYACFMASEDNPPDTAFFNFRADDGLPTNIHIKRFSISNYVRRAILFYGDREDEATGWNGYNSVEDCIFTDIGNARKPEMHFCYSVICCYNSRYNRISNCRFRNIANAPADLPVIVVYFAHYASYNDFIDCESSRVYGDAVRIRDFSNENYIAYNYFWKTGGLGVITHWYCIPEHGECTKIGPECPSWENRFENNICKGDRECEIPRIFYDHKPMNTNDCPPTPITYQERVRVSNCTAEACDVGEGNEKDIKINYR